MAVSRSEIHFRKISDYKPTKGKNTCANCIYCLKYDKDLFHHSTLDIFKTRKIVFPMLVDEIHFGVDSSHHCKFHKGKK